MSRRPIVSSLLSLIESRLEVLDETFNVPGGIGQVPMDVAQRAKFDVVMHTPSQAHATAAVNKINAGDLFTGTAITLPDSKGNPVDVPSHHINLDSAEEVGGGHVRIKGRFRLTSPLKMHPSFFGDLIRGRVAAHLGQARTVVSRRRVAVDTDKLTPTYTWQPHTTEIPKHEWSSAPKPMIASVFDPEKMKPIRAMREPSADEHLTVRERNRGLPAGKQVTASYAAVPHHELHLDKHIVEDLEHYDATPVGKKLVAHRGEDALHALAASHGGFYIPHTVDDKGKLLSPGYIMRPLSNAQRGRFGPGYIHVEGANVSRKVKLTDQYRELVRTTGRHGLGRHASDFTVYNAKATDSEVVHQRDLAYTTPHPSTVGGPLVGTHTLFGHTLNPEQAAAHTRNLLRAVHADMDDEDIPEHERKLPPHLHSLIPVPEHEKGLKPEDRAMPPRPEGGHENVFEKGLKAEVVNDEAPHEWAARVNAEEAERVKAGKPAGATAQHVGGSYVKLHEPAESPKYHPQEPMEPGEQWRPGFSQRKNFVPTTTSPEARDIDKQIAAKKDKEVPIPTRGSKPILAPKVEPSSPHSTDPAHINFGTNESTRFRQNGRFARVDQAGGGQNVTSVPRAFRERCMELGGKVKQAGAGMVVVFEDLAKSEEAFKTFVAEGMRVVKHDIPGILFVETRLAESLIESLDQALGADHAPGSVVDPSIDLDAMISQHLDTIPGGKGDGKDPKSVCPAQLKAGIHVEMEHTHDAHKAMEIALDHLTEKPDYYTRLFKSGISDEPGADPATQTESEVPASSSSPEPLPVTYEPPRPTPLMSDGHSLSVGTHRKLATRLGGSVHGHIEGHFGGVFDRRRAGRDIYHFSTHQQAADAHQFLDHRGWNVSPPTPMDAATINQYAFNASRAPIMRKVYHPSVYGVKAAVAGHHDAKAEAEAEDAKIKALYGRTPGLGGAVVPAGDEEQAKEQPGKPVLKPKAAWMIAHSDDDDNPDHDLHVGGRVSGLSDDDDEDEGKYEDILVRLDRAIALSESPNEDFSQVFKSSDEAEKVAADKAEDQGLAHAVVDCGDGTFLALPYHDAESRVDSNPKYQIHATYDDDGRELTDKDPDSTGETDEAVRAHHSVGAMHKEKAHLHVTTHRKLRMRLANRRWYARNRAKELHVNRPRSVNRKSHPYRPIKGHLSRS